LVLFDEITEVVFNLPVRKEESLREFRNIGRLVRIMWDVSRRMRVLLFWFMKRVIVAA
jgi:hypothetical protein